MTTAMRKCLLWMVATLLGTTILSSAAMPPALINYQGVLRDKTTGLPLNATVNVAFTFYPDPSSTGTGILSDTHAGVAVSAGLFGVQLGGGVEADGAGPGVYTSLADVFRDFGEVSMQIRIGAEILTPRVRIGAAAYALNAASALSAASAANATQLGGLAASQYIKTTAGPQTIAGGLSVGSLTLTGPGPLALSSGSALQFPDGTVAASTRTPLEIATLRWYRIPFTQAVPVLDAFAVASDGTNVWAVSNTTNAVFKVRASDAAVLGSYAVGHAPGGIAFTPLSIYTLPDYLWVTNNIDNSVSRIRVADGVTDGPFPVGSLPLGLAFDGTHLWVANNGENTVTRLFLDGSSDGTVVVGDNPFAVAFAGDSVWVTNESSDTVTKISTSGVVLGTYPVATTPLGLAFDGSCIWVANVGNFTVTKLRASDGANLGTFPVGDAPVGVVFDGTSIWVANQGDDTVTRLRLYDGATIDTFSTPAVPTALAFDGSSIWIATLRGNRLMKQNY